MRCIRASRLPGAKADPPTPPQRQFKLVDWIAYAPPGDLTAGVEWEQGGGEGVGGRGGGGGGRVWCGAVG